MLQKFTRFKHDFLSDLQSMFDNLVDLTEPICQALDPALASMTLFDTSGIEAWVTENNPKYANRIIKQLKTYAKANHFNKNYNPTKQHMVLCLLMRIPILPFSRCITLVISVTPINLASLQMDLGA